MLTVAPYAGAWIETIADSPPREVEVVAPYAGAWIETLRTRTTMAESDASPPTRGRGLKPVVQGGAAVHESRPLRGGVD